MQISDGADPVEALQRQLLEAACPTAAFDRRRDWTGGAIRRAERAMRNMRQAIDKAPLARNEAYFCGRREQAYVDAGPLCPAPRTKAGTARGF
jgi:hypothetical protein